MRLNELRDRLGARKPRKRRGRGIGSGIGKTARHGHKGHKARSGGSAYAEGGQTPLYRRLPKRGIKAASNRMFGIVNLKEISRAIERKRLESDKIITESKLVAAGLLRKGRAARLLGEGEIKHPVRIYVYYATSSARRKVQGIGGEIITNDAYHELSFLEGTRGEEMKLRTWINNDKNQRIVTGKPFELKMSIFPGNESVEEINKVGNNIALILASDSVIFERSKLSLHDIFIASQEGVITTVEGVAKKKGENEVEIMLYYNNNYLRSLKHTIETS